MVGARLEYCTKWQRMASAQESNNQMAIGGSRRPTETFVARQLTNCADKKKNCGAAIDGSRRPKEKLRRSNRGSRRPKKNCGPAIDGLRRPKEKLQRGNQQIAPAKKKIAARQSTDRAGQKKNCGAAINRLRRPREKLRPGNQRIAPAKRKIAARQSGIAPAKRKIAARQSRIAPAKRKIAARQSGIAPAGQNKIAMAQQSPWRRPKQMTYRNVLAAGASYQSAKAGVAWGNGKSESNMEHHLRERSFVKHGAQLKREASGRINDLGLQLLSPAEESDSWHQWCMYRHNWESRMAVKRVLLS